MSTSLIYKEYLTGNIVKNFLKKGTIPTKKDVEIELEAKIAENPFLDRPFINKSKYYIEEKEVSSASKINTSMDLIESDLTVIYRSLVSQAKKVTDSYDVIGSELNSIEKKIKRLEDKVQGLLLVGRNIDGYKDYLSDNFVNNDKTDLVNTSCFVDNAAGIVTLPLEGQSRIPLDLDESDVQFNVVTRDQLQSVTLAPGSTKLNAFKDENLIWSQKVNMARGAGRVTAELIFRINNTSSSVSKILLKPASSEEGSISTAILQYSDDGLNWSNVDGEGTLRIIEDTSFNFSPVKANYWKIIFNKSGYDEFLGGAYIYEFGLKSVQMYGASYEDIAGTLYSKALRTDSSQSFNRVSLKVCEHLPENTDIKYRLAALTAAERIEYNLGNIGLNDLNFVSIDPLDRDVRSNQIIIDFSRLDPMTGISSTYSMDDGIDFRYRSNFSKAINYSLPTSVIKEETKVLRNTGDNALDSGSNTSVKVNRISNGWGFDGINYSCELYISENSGKIIDFGPNEIELDNAKTNGRTFLSKGFHKFKTHKDSWREFAPQDITSSTSENPDVLYPFNHKFLIEGLGDSLYGIDLIGDLGGATRKEIIDPDGVYIQPERYWEKTIESLSIYDFIENVEEDNTDIFSIIKDFNGTERIIIKHDPEPGLLDEEKLAIITKTANSDLFESIILKAELTSENSEVTPILQDYLIRLGY